MPQEAAPYPLIRQMRLLPVSDDWPTQAFTRSLRKAYLTTLGHFERSPIRYPAEVWLDTQTQHRYRIRAMDNPLGTPSGSVYPSRSLTKELIQSRQRYHPRAVNGINNLRSNLPHNTRGMARGQHPRGTSKGTRFDEAQLLRLVRPRLLQENNGPTQEQQGARDHQPKRTTTMLFNRGRHQVSSKSQARSQLQGRKDIRENKADKPQRIAMTVEGRRHPSKVNKMQRESAHRQEKAGSRNIPEEYPCIQGKGRRDFASVSYTRVGNMRKKSAAKKHIPSIKKAIAQPSKSSNRKGKAEKEVSPSKANVEPSKTATRKRNVDTYKASPSKGNVEISKRDRRKRTKSYQSLSIKKIRSRGACVSKGLASGSIVNVRNAFAKRKDGLDGPQGFLLSVRVEENILAKGLVGEATRSREGTRVREEGISIYGFLFFVNARRWPRSRRRRVKAEFKVQKRGFKFISQNLIESSVDYSSNRNATRGLDPKSTICLRRRHKFHYHWPGNQGNLRVDYSSNRNTTRRLDLEAAMFLRAWHEHHYRQPKTQGNIWVDYRSNHNVARNWSQKLQ
uniref:Uncharacterized protein LOC104249600 n=1 Tax=Nicotiana sylvestris TaxID=4096 RepID=A0A1U7YMM3_NICSY|nr:PREDICTED: uncharacterized protein LOC104249600 [Nicotiana sylvestris]